MDAYFFVKEENLALGGVKVNDSGGSSGKTLPTRMKKNVKRYVKHLIKVLNEQKNNPLVLEPCIRSKLNAALEFVLLNRCCAKANFELKNELEWPVRREYILEPKRFTFYDVHPFVTTILKDAKSIFISCDFELLSYQVFEFKKELIPFVDTDFNKNLERIDQLEYRLLAYFRRIKPNQKLPQVPSFVRDFLTAIVPTRTEFQERIVEKNLMYEKLLLVNYDTNPVNEGMNGFYRLYRTVMPILHEQHCVISKESTIQESEGDEDNSEVSEPIKLEPEYNSEIIPLVFRSTDFFISFVEGLGDFYLILRNSRFNYITGFKIPNRLVPTFSSDSYAIFCDNLRIMHFTIFLKVALVNFPSLLCGIELLIANFEAINQEFISKARSRSRSRSNYFSLSDSSASDRG